MARHKYTYQEFPKFMACADGTPLRDEKGVHLIAMDAEHEAQIRAVHGDLVPVQTENSLLPFKRRGRPPNALRIVG